jgi:GMP synthase-like glutamine amidotransferase
MRIHTLQHVDFEGLGSIEAWAKDRGASITYSRMFADAPLPALSEFDWLLVLGGPMNIYQEDVYPWLCREKTFINEAILAGKIVLGICLGAQLIADVLGAEISRNQHREIGWFPLTSIHPSMSNIIQAKAPVFHWHGDTFTLPAGAERLAESAACLNQGFMYRDRVLGLQFHLETTIDSLNSLIDHSRDELTEGPYIQTPEEMVAHPERLATINQMMVALLDHLHRI